MRKVEKIKAAMARENEEAAGIASSVGPPRKQSVVVKAGPLAPG